MPGYFPMFYDAIIRGKVYLEIDRWNNDFLYVNSLPAGVGSNDIGLDRGQIGASMIVPLRALRSQNSPRTTQPEFPCRYRQHAGTPRCGRILRAIGDLGVSHPKPKKATEF